MNPYEEMIAEFSNDIIVDDTAILPYDIKGFYANNGKRSLVLLNRNLETVNEKVCVLAEEIGHHFTSVGDITNQSDIKNRKQELRARKWAVEKIASLEDFIKAFEAGCRTKEELAEYLNVTDGFLSWSINHYQKKYGLMTTVDKQYIVYFEPLGIIKLFEW